LAKRTGDKVNRCEQNGNSELPKGGLNNTALGAKTWGKGVAKKR